MKPRFMTTPSLDPDEIWNRPSDQSTRAAKILRGRRVVLLAFNDQKQSLSGPSRQETKEMNDRPKAQLDYVPTLR
jgi:hypothetical protein